MQRLLLATTLALGLVACKNEAPPAPETAHAAAAETKTRADAKPEPPITFTAEQLSAFGALPARRDRKDNLVSAERIDLGRMLYYDARLSKNQDISCNTCHVLSEFGIDPRGERRTSPGHKGQMGGRNAPTVYNAALHFRQFWDGRADTVEDQAKGPPLNPIEMALKDEAAVEQVLASIPGYGDLFAKAFPGEKKPITFDNMALAIGVFERGLMTPSRFDAFLGGDTNALTPPEKKGMQRFLALGCPTCHNGVALGATSFQKLGLIEPWPDQSDAGRFEVTKNETDRMKFKPPSLRNVAKTAPYTHTGKIDDLGEMVRLMARHQLGKKDLDDADVDAIVTFLGALTGTLPTKYIAEPALPESGPRTPKPDPT